MERCEKVAWHRLDEIGPGQQSGFAKCLIGRESAGRRRWRRRGPAWVTGPEEGAACRWPLHGFRPGTPKLMTLAVWPAASGNLPARHG